MSQQIKLMADYQSWPLWWSGDHTPGNIDPAALPLTHETRTRLQIWSDTFDSALNWEDPASNPEVNLEDIELFEKEGIDLWLKLREELMPSYSVVYHSLKHHKVFIDPEELEKFGRDI